MKKISIILISVLLFASLTACESSSHKHEYDEGVVVRDAVCGETKEIKYSCKSCEHTYTKAFTVDHNWQKATCTAPKTCSICDAKDGEKLEHSYEDNVCKLCDNVINITVTLPALDTPIEIKNYLNDSLVSTYKITDVSYTYTAASDDNVKLTIAVSGEKVSDAIGADLNTVGNIVYKLFDEEGFVVASGTFSTPYLDSEDKFNEKIFTISGLNNGQKYILAFVDYYTTK